MAVMGDRQLYNIMIKYFNAVRKKATSTHRPIIIVLIPSIIHLINPKFLKSIFIGFGNNGCRSHITIFKFNPCGTMPFPVSHLSWEIYILIKYLWLLVEMAGLLHY